MRNTRSNFDIIFLGLAQNCEKYLPNFFNKIEEISKNYRLKVIIGENGSTDFTFDLIQKKISQSNIYDLVDTTFIEKFSDRIKRLALAREAIKKNLIESKITSEFVCVIDLDEVINENFNSNLIKNLSNYLKKNEDKYFGISVSSKPYYYDILNYESLEYPNQFIKQLQNNKSIRSYKDRKKYIYNVQKKLTTKNSFECISGFNGMCIYQYKDYIMSNYSENIQDQTPEHLLFNRYLNKKLNKKILVTSNFFRMPNEHKPLNNIFQFMFEKVLKYFNIYLKKLLN